MDQFGRIAANFDVERLKQPLCILRLVQIPMALMAFATTTGFHTKLELQVNCDGAHDKSYDFGFPFSLADTTVPADLCTGMGQALVYHQNYDAQAGWFVAVGVFALISAIFSALIYTFFGSFYEANTRVVNGDLILTVIIAVFWMIATLSWVSAVGAIKHASTDEVIMLQLRNVQPCVGAAENCNITTTPAYGGLTLSILFGFICFGLWVAAAWLLFKASPLANPPARDIYPQSEPAMYTSAPPPRAQVHEPRIKSQYQSFR